VKQIHHYYVKGVAVTPENVSDLNGVTFVG